jgi:hypothetical protein
MTQEHDSTPIDASPTHTATEKTAGVAREWQRRKDVDALHWQRVNATLKHAADVLARDGRSRSLSARHAEIAIRAAEQLHCQIAALVELMQHGRSTPAIALSMDDALAKFHVCSWACKQAWRELTASKDPAEQLVGIAAGQASDFLLRPEDRPQYLPGDASSPSPSSSGGN